MSMDAERMEAWIINRFNGSTFEFAVDPTLETSSEGITLTPDTADSPL